MTHPATNPASESPALPLRAVTFDLWQTLLLDNRELGLTRTEARLEGARLALREAGEDYPLEELRLAYWDCFQQCREIRERLLDVSFAEQVAMFVGNISPGLTERLPTGALERIARIYADSFLQYPPPAHDDALAALQGVKDMGLKIGLISNTGMTPGATFRTYLANTGMLAYFDALTFSDEVKICKPAKEIFLLSLRELGAVPGEAVHVGDQIGSDIAGARQCGMKSVWITGFSERQDPTDPTTEPDAVIGSLGEVVAAITRLAAR